MGSTVNPCPLLTRLRATIAHHHALFTCVRPDEFTLWPGPVAVNTGSGEASPSLDPTKKASYSGNRFPNFSRPSQGKPRGIDMRSSRNSGDAGAARSHVNRRQFLAGSTALSAAILSGAAMPLAGAAQEGEGQFNAAWPFEAPPTGHINSFVPASIIGPNSVYGFALWLPLAFYTWSTEEWMPQLATNWGFLAAGSDPLPAEPED